MALAHRRVVQRLDERERGVHVLDRVLQALVARPVLDKLVAALDFLLQLLVLVRKVLDVDVVPLGVAPLHVDRLHHRDHVPHPLQLHAVLEALVDLAVLDLVQLEKLLQLAQIVRRRLHLRHAAQRARAAVGVGHHEVVRAVVHGVDLLVGLGVVVEVLEGHLLAELAEEGLDARLKLLALLLELVGLRALLLLQVALGHELLLLQVVPRQRRLLQLLQDVLRRLHLVLAQQRYRVPQRLEHRVRRVGPLAHVAQVSHNREHRPAVRVRHLRVERRVGLGDELHEVQDPVRDLLEQVLLVLRGPLGDPHGEGVLDWLGIDLDPADGLGGRQLPDLLLERLVLDDLLVEGREHRVLVQRLGVRVAALLLPLVELGLDVLGPEVRVGHEQLAELLALDLALVDLFVHRRDDVLHPDVLLHVQQ
eukprot:3253310-Rhodomonas_salina.2